MSYALKLLFLLIALAAFSAVGAAQDDEKIAVTGKYQIRQNDIDRLIEIYEWMLAGKFTESQRRRFQTAIVEQAQNSAETQLSVQAILKYHAKVKAADERTRLRFERENLPQMLEIMEKEGGETNAVLLEVYRDGLNRRADRTIEDSPALDSGGTINISDLAGLWTTGSLTGDRYKSLATGELTAPSGSLIEYEIKPNGQVVYASYSSNSFYSCTNQMFVYKTGRVSVSGARLTFEYASGSRTTIPCAASKREAAIPAERKTVAFRFERDEYGVKLCTTDEDGADLCLRKARE